MPRKPFHACSIYPYHITARTNNRDWFDRPLPFVWEVFEDYLYLLAVGFGAEISAFVLMNNHYHLIARFPEGNISQALCHFQRETSRCLAKHSNRINHIYGTRFYRSRMTRILYYYHAYKYVYRNPVEAGLTKCVLQYPFSSLHGLLGKSPLRFPMIEDLLLFSDVEGTLSWLNQAPLKTHRESIRRALKHPDFKLAKIRGRHVLERVTY